MDNIYAHEKISTTTLPNKRALFNIQEQNASYYMKTIPIWVPWEYAAFDFWLFKRPSMLEHCTLNWMAEGDTEKEDHPRRNAYIHFCWVLLSCMIVFESMIWYILSSFHVTLVLDVSDNNPITFFWDEWIRFPHFLLITGYICSPTSAAFFLLFLDPKQEGLTWTSSGSKVVRFE
jgi:hypothetical protein